MQFKNKKKKPSVLDRFPARPYIVEGHLINITAIVNETVTFNCPVLADIAVHVQWARYRAFNDTDGNLNARPDTIQLEVLFIMSFPFQMVSLISVMVFEFLYWNSSSFTT